MTSATSPPRVGPGVCHARSAAVVVASDEVLGGRLLTVEGERHQAQLFGHPCVDTEVTASSSPSTTCHSMACVVWARHEESEHG